MILPMLTQSVITPELVGLTFSTAGELLLAVTVLTVHHKMKKEHKIDQFVINEITFEEVIGILAILMIVVGYMLQMRFFSQFA